MLTLTFDASWSWSLSARSLLTVGTIYSRRDCCMEEIKKMFTDRKWNTSSLSSKIDLFSDFLLTIFSKCKWFCYSFSLKIQTPPIGKSLHDNHLLPDCTDEYPWNSHAYTLEEDPNQSNVTDPMYSILSKSRIYNHHKLHEEDNDDHQKIKHLPTCIHGFLFQFFGNIIQKCTPFRCITQSLQENIIWTNFCSLNLQEYNRRICSVNHWLNISDHYQKYSAYHSLVYRVRLMSNFCPRLNSE